MPSAEIWIGLGGLMLHGIGITLAGIWRLQKSRDEVIAHVDKYKRTIDEKLDGDRRNVGETIEALRTKINLVELDGFKNFVRRDSFHQIVEQISKEIESTKAELAARMDRQEGKIDRLIERTAPRIKEKD